MNSLCVESSDQAIEVNFPKAIAMDREAFFEFCQSNKELRIERDAEGRVIIMSPTGAKAGRGNASLIAQVYTWAKADGSGVVFDSATGFELPNGATRSPDVSWLPLEEWEALPVADRERFAPICPRFVIELRSPTDRLAVLQAKMGEYLANGATLGFLIDPQERRVHVYRPGRSSEILDEPPELTGDPEMPGLTLQLDDVW